MDSFQEDSQLLLGMKRKFEQMISQPRDSPLGNIRQNLLSDFEEADMNATLSKRQDRSSSLRQLSFSPSSPSQSDSSTLVRQMKLKDVEITSLKAAKTKLENRIAVQQREMQQASIENDRKVMECKTAKDNETKKVAELKSKLQYVMEREKNAREDVNRLEKELQHQSLEAGSKVLSEQREKMESNDKLEQAQAAWEEKEMLMQEHISAQRNKISELQIKYEESVAKLALKGSDPQFDSVKRIQELETSLQEERSRAKDLETRFAEHEDNIVATKALKADLDMVPSLKSELEKTREDNARLCSNEQNTILLEEELHSVKKKLEQQESLSKRNTELEVENEELKERLGRWELSDASGSRRPQSPCSLSRHAQDVEATNASLLLHQGELQSSVNLMERKLQKVEAEKQKISTDLTSEKRTTAQLNDLVKRLKRKMFLQSKERTAYKDLLDSYESEVTVNVDAEKASQIQKLEEIVQEYQSFVDESETKIEALTNQLEESMAKFDQVQQQLQIVNHPSASSSQKDLDTIQQLREQNIILENEIAKIRDEKDILDAKIEQRQLQGDYDPTKTKIIHMLKNPHSMAQQARQEELHQLREDNDKLRKRNQLLEENRGNLQDLTMQVEEKMQHLSPSKEVEELKSQLASAEMRNKRLREVFAKTSKEFREVCYQLTGYRLDIPCAYQYRLTSMYAERQKDYLLFQQNSQGEIQLLQTDFSMTFQDAMENCLQKMKSLPLFLSHITTELFSRQTLNL